jgi:hypothetical protein
MKPTKIETIWQELESDKLPLYSHIIYKRFSSDIKPDIYVALKTPEQLRCVAARVNQSVDFNVDRFCGFLEIKIDTFADNEHPGKKFLLIILLDKLYQDIFATLCEDLMNQVSDIIDEKILVQELLSRLIKWQSIFEKSRLFGLSEESQIGLFGELYFMRKFLEHNSNYKFCLDTWKGPEQAVQDYQFSNIAVEIKTTHGKNHQKIQISSERQLDTDIIPNIYLFHLSVDVREDNGETLNEIIDSILDIIKGNGLDIITFKQKLLDVGYFENQRDMYSKNGYTIRQERYFMVTGDFPRIVESQISRDIGDVKYSIIIGDNAPWKISEEELFSRMGEKYA